MNDLLSKRWWKPALLLLSLIPLTRLLWGFHTNDLSANPVEFIEHSTGDWAIRLLLVTLLITPLRKLTGWSQLSRFRRMLGLFAFFYALLHFSAYLWFDQEFDLKGIFEDIGKRRYVTVGFLGWVSMAALAATSTAGWVRRLGVARWNRLHKLVYLGAAAAVVHYYWLVKSDIRLPVMYGSTLTVLMLARLQQSWARRSQAGVPVKLIRIHRETDDAVTLTFALPPSKTLSIKPGQFMTFDWLVNGEKAPRSYSVSSQPSRGESFDITVKKQGLVSTFLNETARVGLEVVAHGPYGRFALDATQHSAAVFFAGGSGITPIISMLRHLEEVSPNATAVLFYASRNDRQIIFQRELDRLKAKLPNLLIIQVVSEPSPAWGGERGRINRDMVERTLSSVGGKTFFLCGPEGFMVEAQQILTSLAVQPTQILRERFSPSAAAPSDSRRIVQCTVEFVSAAKTVTCTSADTLLSAAEKHGIAIPASCRIGQCGTCATRVLRGHVEMETDEGLTPTMRSEGFGLLCVGRARGMVSLDA
jgi:ferredoxin-NADP reductase/DMSO/TMAO reductase YedYZ heme-binding membrane subunit